MSGYGVASNPAEAVEWFRRGADRGLHAGIDGMTYLSVHRRRDWLTITRR